MPLSYFKINEREKKEFPPLPEDVYQVELLDISSKVVDSKYNKVEKETILSFQFTVVEEGELRGRNIWRNNVPSELWISSKGKNLLYQIIEAIIMRDLKEEERQMMDSTYINKLIGYQCRLVVKNTKDGDKVWNNIESFLPKKQALPKLTEEERDTATVKKKNDDNQGMTTTSEMRQVAQPSQVDDIPTINIEEDVTDEVAPPVEPNDNDDIKIDDVPF